MPPRKRLLLSAYCEAVAKKCAKGEAVPADELKNAVAEATSHLASPLHLRHTDEFRMCLALLAATESVRAQRIRSLQAQRCGFRSAFAESLPQLSELAGGARCCVFKNHNRHD